MMIISIEIICDEWWWIAYGLINMLLVTGFLFVFDTSVNLYAHIIVYKKLYYTFVHLCIVCNGKPTHTHTHKTLTTTTLQFCWWEMCKCVCTSASFSRFAACHLAVCGVFSPPPPSSSIHYRARVAHSSVCNTHTQAHMHTSWPFYAKVRARVRSTQLRRRCPRAPTGHIHNICTTPVRALWLSYKKYIRLAFCIQLSLC